MTSRNKGKRQLLEKMTEDISHYFRTHPKRTIGMMALILIAGIISIFIRKASLKEETEHPIQEIMKQLPIQDSMKAAHYDQLEELQDVIKLERRLNEVLEKDTLSYEDSLFIMKVNQKLNKMIHEKYQP